MVGWSDNSNLFSLSILEYEHICFSVFLLCCYSYHKLKNVWLIKNTKEKGNVTTRWPKPFCHPRFGFGFGFTLISLVDSEMQFWKVSIKFLKARLASVNDVTQHPFGTDRLSLGLVIHFWECGWGAILVCNFVWLKGNAYWKIVLDFMINGYRNCKSA